MHAIENKNTKYCRELFLGSSSLIALGIESEGSITPFEVSIFVDVVGAAPCCL